MALLAVPFVPFDLFILFLWSARSCDQTSICRLRGYPSRKIELGPTHRPRNTIRACSSRLTQSPELQGPAGRSRSKGGFFSPPLLRPPVVALQKQRACPDDQQPTCIPPAFWPLPKLLYCSCLVPILFHVKLLDADSSKAPVLPLRPR